MMLSFSNSYQSLPPYFYAPAQAASVPYPQFAVYNDELARALGVDSDELDAGFFAGQDLPNDLVPIAQAYAGHQFGQLAVLGDGRAILLGEVETTDGSVVDVQLKGAGQTAFSRHGDGKATLAPMLREYLISEAMFALGVPTTRSLAVVTTGETVRRRGKRHGAILTRIASSHLRVGTFVYASLLAQKQRDLTPLNALLDYAIARHYPECTNAENPALAFLEAVISRQIELVTDWLRIGFVHGVLNTDNVAISGETIDYGPCAFLDEYHPNTVFSSIDEFGRYAFAKQLPITEWNLTRFAESLLPLISKDEQDALEMTMGVLAKVSTQQASARLEMYAKKLGMSLDNQSQNQASHDNESDTKLIHDLLALMQSEKLDYTNTFVYLTAQLMQDDVLLETDVYQSGAFKAWEDRWQARRQCEPKAASLASMQTHNPVFIPRNHLVENALAAAENGNLKPFELLLTVIKTPYAYDKLTTLQPYRQPAPAEWQENYETYCGT